MIVGENSLHNFIAGAHMCVLAFSCIDRDSFLALENWKKKVSATINPIGGIMMSFLGGE